MSADPPAGKPPMSSLPPAAAEGRAGEDGPRKRVIIPPAPEVYLVIQDRGGIFGAYLDAYRAMEAARNIGGVVCTLPIAADFRPASEPLG
jgi:hypothetical protein